MKYLDDRDEKIKNFHEIYNKNVPEFIEELLNISEFKRLEHTRFDSGIGLTKFDIFPYDYSVLDHAIGVALIINKFTADLKYTMAGLVNALAIPAFGKCIDFIDNNLKTELNASYGLVVGSDELFNYFFKRKIEVSEVCDSKRYPLIKFAKELETILHISYFSGILSFEEVKAMYDNIVLVKNEEGYEEFAFETPSIAEKFCELSIKISQKYNSYEAKISMKLIANVLEMMIARGEIKFEDLYAYSDKGIYEIGVNSSDKKIREAWEKIRNLNKVYTKFNPLEDKYCVKIVTEVKYIDPIVNARGGYIRLSKISYKATKLIESCADMLTDLYMYVD